MSAFNYFNYFTEIEEYFWRKRGAHLLVSPLDWAIVETWQKAGIPLDAVLRGIDSAFESYQRSRRARRPAAEEPGLLRGRRARRRRAKERGRGGHRPAGQARRAAQQEPFSREELRAFFARNGERLARSRRASCARSDAGTRRAASAQTRAQLAEIALRCSIRRRTRSRRSGAAADRAGRKTDGGA